MQTAAIAFPRCATDLDTVTLAAVQFGDDYLHRMCLCMCLTSETV